jgi:hypothetical protein
VLIATVEFAGWHYLQPIFGAAPESSFLLYTVQGLAATFAAGLLYGHGLQGTGSFLPAGF